MNYIEISKELFEPLYKARDVLKQSPVKAEIRALVELRVSQLNGCAYCCRMHTDEARKAGITQEKLDVLPGFRDSSKFSKEEKLALEWAELLTSVTRDKEGLKKQLLDTFSEKEVVDLTTCIALINSWNRIARYLI